jgi:hypothetical protein
MPTDPAPKSIEPAYNSAVGSVSNPFNKKQQIQDWQSSFTEIIVTIPPMTPDTALFWKAFLVACNGIANVFALPPAVSALLPPSIGPSGYWRMKSNMSGWSVNDGLIHGLEFELREVLPIADITLGPVPPGGGGPGGGGPGDGYRTGGGPCGGGMPSVKPPFGTPLNLAGPYYSRIVQAWLFAEGTGTVTAESKHGYNASFDPTGVEWVTDGICVAHSPNIHINGGFPLGSDPGTSVFPADSSGYEVGQFSLMNGPTNAVNPRNFSVILWVKASPEYAGSYPYDAALIFKSDLTVTNNDDGSYDFHATKGFSLELTRTPEITFTMYSYDDTESWRDWYYPNGDSPDPSTIFGRWTQIVITTDDSLDLSASKLYVNGVEVTGGIGDFVVPDYLPDDVVLNFGGSPDSGDPHLATPSGGGAHRRLGQRGSRPLNGQIDNLIFLSGTLTAAEVFELYNNPYLPWY